MLMKFLYIRLIILILIFLPLSLFSQASFAAGNIVIPAYEKYIMKGLDSDKKEIGYVIEYQLKENAGSGIKKSLRPIAPNSSTLL